jgi:hypothetical protein
VENSRKVRFPRVFAACCSSSRRGKRQIVRPIGNQFVAKRFLNLIAVDFEGPRHALDIASWRADEVAGKPSRQHAENALAVDILPPMGPQEAKRLIEPPLDVAESRHVGQAMGREKPLGLALVR